MIYYNILRKLKQPPSKSARQEAPEIGIAITTRHQKKSWRAHTVLEGGAERSLSNVEDRRNRAMGHYGGES